MFYRIAIGADHRGYELKEALKKHVKIDEVSITWIDEGAHSAERSDYPLYAKKVVEAIKSGKAELGVLLCGTGNGIAIAANRSAGIRAAVVWNEEIARLAKADDNANVFVFPADYVDEKEALILLGIWLREKFKEGRYQERLSMIDG